MQNARHLAVVGKMSYKQPIATLVLHFIRDGSFFSRNRGYMFEDLELDLFIKLKIKHMLKFNDRL